MNKLLPLSLLFSVSSVAFADDVLTFCLNKENIDTPVYFAVNCPTFVQNWITSTAAASTQKAAADAITAENLNTSNKVKMLTDLAAAIPSPSAPKTVDLSAFTSLSQRQQADLGYKIGIKIHEKFKSERLLKERLYLTNDINTLRSIIQVEQPSIVKAEIVNAKNGLPEAQEKLNSCLNKVTDDFKKTTAVPSLPVQPSFALSGGVAESAAAVGVLVNVSKLIVDFSTTKIADAKTIAAPTALLDVVTTSLMTPDPSKFQIYQPSIRVDNEIIKALSDFQSQYDSEVKAVTKIGKEYKVVTDNGRVKDAKEAAAKCAANASKKLSELAEVVEKLTTKDEKNGIPSRAERAALAVEFERANIKKAVLISAIATGGAVASIQPRFALAPRLVMGADLAITYKVVNIENGETEAAGYVSDGCAGVMKPSEFSSKYKLTACGQD